MIVDKEIFSLLNSLVKVPILIDVIKIVVNEYFVPVGLSLILFYLWITEGKYNKQTVVLAAASVGLSNLIVKIINLYFYRARPFQEMSVNLAYYRPTDSGFPANSAAVAFAMASAIWLFNPKLGKWALLTAAAYALARVVVGVHYPSDVLAGAALGICVTYLLSRFKRALEWVTATLISLLKIVKLEPIS